MMRMHGVSLKLRLEGNHAGRGERKREEKRERDQSEGDERRVWILGGNGTQGRGEFLSSPPHLTPHQDSKLNYNYINTIRITC